MFSLLNPDTFLLLPLENKDGVRFQINNISGSLESDAILLRICHLETNKNNTIPLHRAASEFYVKDKNKKVLLGQWLNSVIDELKDPLPFSDDESRIFLKIYHGSQDLDRKTTSGIGDWFNMAKKWLNSNVTDLLEKEGTRINWKELKHLLEEDTRKWSLKTSETKTEKKLNFSLEPSPLPKSFYSELQTAASCAWYDFLVSRKENFDLIPYLTRGTEKYFSKLCSESEFLLKLFKGTELKTFYTSASLLSENTDTIKRPKKNNEGLLSIEIETGGGYKLSLVLPLLGDLDSKNQYLSIYLYFSAPDYDLEGAKKVLIPYMNDLVWSFETFFREYKYPSASLLNVSLEDTEALTQWLPNLKDPSLIQKLKILQKKAGAITGKNSSISKEKIAEKLYQIAKDYQK